MAIVFRVTEKSRDTAKLLRKIDRMPIEIQRELKKQGLEKAGEVILRKAKQGSFGFRDRSGDLRRSIRLGRPKSTQYGVQIPIIAGQEYKNPTTKAHYAGFVELGTINFLPHHYLRRALFSSGVGAIVVLQQELRRILSRLRGI